MTVRTHNGLNRVQGKASFDMVIEVEQQDLEPSLRRVWHTRKRLSERERRRKINSRLIRKYSTIEDLLFSSKNIIAVEEGMKQFNVVFKMLLDAHQEYNQLLEDDERGRDDNWMMMLTLKCVPSRGRCIVG